MKCKLTGVDGKAVKAHIIPRSFYSLAPKEGPNIIYSNKKGEFPRRSNIGIYDSEILTEEGEAIFSPWDDYADQLLIKKREEFEELFHFGECVGFKVAEYDYAKLKLFALSVLWRAHISKQKFFEKVALGPHESKIRELLLSGEVSETDSYDVVWAKWSDTADAGILCPWKTRFDGLSFYLIYLAGFVAYIKVDSRRPKKGITTMRMEPDKPLIFAARKFLGSKELPLLLKLTGHS